MKATKNSEEYRNRKILKAKPPKTITKTHYQAPTSSQRFPATTRSLNHRAPSRYQQGTNRERSRYYNKTAAHRTPHPLWKSITLVAATVSPKR
ncbi:unnamed protein product [Acanthoscelides obtectus]|uniref:Uncharacterized protein n=1 Tax=Acanthoscelides obtectus TaxID=200917 RepID=A0A9P0KQ56_ACAOB|nr:unnamed protein product [Acanthoscelides obtectus]CAK1641682.1 hypothetical protein AOBTE_LOCUS12556 [Acanthoscelides obtectus]